MIVWVLVSDTNFFGEEINIGGKHNKSQETGDPETLSSL